MGRIPFARNVVAAFRALVDPRTPTTVRLVVAAAAVYLISPIDAVPDALLGLGLLDDTAIVFGAIRKLLQHVRPEHVEEADRFFGRQTVHGEPVQQARPVDESTPLIGHG